MLWRDSGEHRRSGFAVSRQIRGAVHRNRARRRVREAFRQAQEAAPSRTVLIVIAKPGVLRQRFGALVGEMESAFAAMIDPGAAG